ncbi:hypothetical protein A3Q56_03021 [Intoshia linei]|uniref:Uncharacterized protein n=1 Tax=Intoshia linei TaxID=1819745 RepID=A0A177B4N7_9BILA|nr:hypothetical protein A3Q56_03021 [Intoshia linei]
MFADFTQYLLYNYNLGKYINYYADLKNTSQSSDRVAIYENKLYTYNVIWCGGVFTFLNYLCIKSLFVNGLATTVIFHYHLKPQMDKEMYYTWFNEIQSSYHNFVLEKFNVSIHYKLCTAFSDAKHWQLKKYTSNYGGFYLYPRIIISSNKINFENGSNLKLDENFLAYSDKFQKCVDSSNLNLVKQKLDTLICLHLNPDYEKKFFPKTLWNNENNLEKFLNNLMYKKNAMQNVPNIGHMVWFGGGELRFEMYLSAASFLFVQKIDSLFIHGDIEFEGFYWKKLKNTGKVYFILTNQTRWVHEQEIPSNYKALMSDIIRADILYTFGGIYIDFDAYFNKKIDINIVKNVMASYDWVNWSHPFPNIINLGVVVSKRFAPFWIHMKKSFKKIWLKSLGYNGLNVPYKILEHEPNLIEINPHLSVICYYRKCHPTWIKNYQDESINHLNIQDFNWKTDTHVYHITYPTPDVFLSEKVLFESHNDHLFVMLGRKIFKLTVYD